MGKNAKKKIRAAIVTFIICTALSGAALADSGKLIPVGAAVGIQIKTDGVMVVDVAAVETDDGSVCPAGDAGILPGDVIVMLGGIETHTAADLTAAVASLSGEPTSVTVERGDRTIQFTVTPALEHNGSPRLGLWLRDGIAGVGTITFIDPETGMFGALGHGVSDIKTGMLLPLSSGNVCRAQIASVKPGKAGEPGELCGNINFSDIVGSIENNTPSGIFGAMAASFSHNAAVPVADDSEIVSGPATILATVSGEDIETYAVEISRTVLGGSDGRSLLVHITDQKLLNMTGGIVQGMSGCPILQNGKLVGAVTHVLVSDPTRGYGITISRMLDELAADMAA
jgi:stage IV sporulation protein B